MRTAHARKVDYEGDIRDEANWMNRHALVGVETISCATASSRLSMSP